MLCGLILSLIRMSCRCDFITLYWQDIVMKLLKIDRRNNSFEAIPESFDGLWHLERLIEEGDFVSGSSERKIKPRTEGEKAFKEKVWVEIKAEKVEFHESTGQLRVQGTVTAAKPEELVPLKSHHALEIAAGEKIFVRKKELKNYDVERLERAKKAGAMAKLAVVLMDDEEAEIFSVSDIGANSRAKIESGKTGKRYGQCGSPEKYYEEIISKLHEMGPHKIVVAGPGFEKQRLEKHAKDKAIKMHFVLESASETGRQGLGELLKSGKLDKIAGEMHSAEEAKAVEKILANTSNGLAAIGLKEVT